MDGGKAGEMRMMIRDIDELIEALCEPTRDRLDSTSHARIRAIVPQFVEDAPEPETKDEMMDRIFGPGGLQETPYSTVRSIYENDMGYSTAFMRRWLVAHEYDGLINPENDNCGCSLDDFAPCDGICGDCRPAFRHADGLMYLEKEDKP